MVHLSCWHHNSKNITTCARESWTCSDVFWIFLNWSKFVWLINFGTAVSVLEFRSVWILRENDSFRWDWRCMCCREWSDTYGMNGHKIYIRKYSFRVNRLIPTFVLHYKINEKISTTTFWTFSFRQLHAMLTTPITRHFFYQTTKQNKITRKWSYSNNRFLI